VVGLSSGVAAVAAGSGHTCAVTQARAIKCWGWNEFGQLGDGSTADRHVPVDVAGLSSGVVAIAAGNAYTCAVGANGQVQCWGAGARTPAQAPELAGDVAVTVGSATGDVQACAMTSVGAVTCWGSNADGQLGDGSTTDSSTAVDAVGLSLGVVSVSAGDGYTCAVTGAGAVECWGADYGPLGGVSYPRSLVPAEVAGLSSGVVAVSAGEGSACVVTTGGGARCWGSNNAGQLGDGSTTNRSVPVDVVGLSAGVRAVSAGGYFACAVTAAGAVQCWGLNVVGQLGDGTTTQRLVPVTVVGF
jgi:alpha-tubulin suppressor-like RCC1 family protein